MRQRTRVHWKSFLHIYFFSSKSVDVYNFEILSQNEKENALQE